MDSFDELDKMLEDILKKIPEKKEELLNNVGDIIQEQVRSNIESRVNTSSEKNEKAKLIDGVDKVVGSGKGYVAIKPDWLKSGMHSWLESGHRIVKNGVVVGFANGTHSYRDAITQTEGQIIKLAEKMVNEVTKDA